MMEVSAILQQYFEEYDSTKSTRISSIDDSKYDSKMAARSDATDAAAEFYVEEQQFDEKFLAVRQRLKEEFRENPLVTGTRTARYQVVSSKIDRRRSIKGEIDRRRSIEEEKGKKKKKRKRRKKRGEDEPAFHVTSLPERLRRPRPRALFLPHEETECLPAPGKIEATSGLEVGLTTKRRSEMRWTRRSATVSQRRIYRSRRKERRCKAMDSRAMSSAVP
ncbi:hypothetical protein BHE74_00033974 [Ensete ventricosum]|nr:hypothetical protein BHE74_00033974 [Ensete ventricosum]